MIIISKKNGQPHRKTHHTSSPTFITEWGCYMYLQLPHGFIAEGETYFQRYEELIKYVPCKMKITNDTLLYVSDIESSFFHIWDYLTLCAKKWNCNQSELLLTSDGISPYPKKHAVINDFPAPKDLIQYSFMVWASKSNCLDLFYLPFHATFWRTN